MPLPKRESFPLPRRLSDQVKDFLKEAIFDKDLRFGEKLPTEEQIATDMNVSKVTVREALRELEAEGLIQKRRGNLGGSFVAEPNHAKMGELILTYIRWGAITPEQLAEFRRLLEPSVIALAVKRRTDQDLAAIKQNIDEVGSAIEAGELDRATALNFHLLVAEACHNPMVSAVMSALMIFFHDAIDRIPMTLEDAKVDLDYSRRFYDCLVEGREEEARDLMISHFDILLEIIKKYQPDPAERNTDSKQPPPST